MTEDLAKEQSMLAALSLYLSVLKILYVRENSTIDKMALAS